MTLGEEQLKHSLESTCEQDGPTVNYWVQLFYPDYLLCYFPAHEVAYSSYPLSAKYRFQDSKTILKIGLFLVIKKEYKWTSQNKKLKKTK